MKPSLSPLISPSHPIRSVCILCPVPFYLCAFDHLKCLPPFPINFKSSSNDFLKSYHIPPPNVISPYFGTIDLYLSWSICFNDMSLFILCFSDVHRSFSLPGYKPFCWQGTRSQVREVYCDPWLNYLCIHNLAWCLALSIHRIIS